MEVKRTCDHCRECRDKGAYLWCRLLKFEVMEDDYCSFGGDISEEDPWDDRMVKDREID